MEEGRGPVASPNVPIVPSLATRTIEPSKILTPPDFDGYYNSFRVGPDQMQQVPPPQQQPAQIVPQSPPPTRTPVVPPIAARRSRSVSASSAFESTMRIVGPNLALLPSTPNVTRNPHAVSGDVEALVSPRMRKLPLASVIPSDGSSPLGSPREGIPTEIPGSPKRKRYTVTVQPDGQAASPTTGKKRRQRQKKTPTQVAVLERHFILNPHPDKQTRDTLALQLGFTSRQVQIWFQNARAKAKHNARKNGLDTNSSPQTNHKVVGNPNSAAAAAHTNSHTSTTLHTNPTPHPQTPNIQNSVVPTAQPLPNGMQAAPNGRKIFSPPFSPPPGVTSPPMSPISPYLSSLALSPRFPTRSPVHAITNSVNNINININNIHNVHNIYTASSPAPTHNPNPNPSVNGNGNNNNSNSMESVPNTPVMMDETPQSPPFLSIPPTGVPLSPALQNMVPATPPQDSQHMMDSHHNGATNAVNLSASAPSQFGFMPTKEMMLDATSTIEEDFFSAVPSSPPSMVSLPAQPPMYSPTLEDASVFLSEQNHKAALLHHMEYHNPLQQQMQLQLLQQQDTQQLLMMQQHGQQLPQPVQPTFVQQPLPNAGADMDFFFYEAPSKNLVFTEGESEIEAFWGESLGS